MTLIERLEAAEAGSRELDDEIATLLFTDKQRHCIKGLSDEAGGMWMFRYPNGSIGSSLRFTTSLDAAMTLVPENYQVPVLLDAINDCCVVSNWVAALPRYICIAALRTRGQS